MKADMLVQADQTTRERLHAAMLEAAQRSRLDPARRAGTVRIGSLTIAHTRGRIFGSRTGFSFYIKVPGRIDLGFGTYVPRQLNVTREYLEFLRAGYNYWSDVPWPVRTTWRESNNGH